MVVMVDRWDVDYRVKFEYYVEIGGNVGCNGWCVIWYNV